MGFCCITGSAVEGLSPTDYDLWLSELCEALRSENESVVTEANQVRPPYDLLSCVAADHLRVLPY